MTNESQYPLVFEEVSEQKVLSWTPYLLLPERATCASKSVPLS